MCTGIQNFILVWLKDRSNIPYTFFRGIKIELEFQARIQTLNGSRLNFTLYPESRYETLEKLDKFLYLFQSCMEENFKQKSVKIQVGQYPSLWKVLGVMTYNLQSAKPYWSAGHFLLEE